MIDMTNRSHNDPDNKNTRKAWKWIILDSAIIGAIAIGASMPSGVPTIAEVWVMAKAFFIAFIFQVAIERGLKKKT